MAQDSGVKDRRLAAGREGSLEAPTRHPIDWQSPDFYEHAALDKELERVFDICHGCRRCFSLCNSFPTLFDLVDATARGEVADVAKADFGKVVEHCYLCDMCYMTKCPYVPPHPWNVDFPHLMLRAKAVHFRDGETRTRDKILSATDVVGRIAAIPVVNEIVNATNRSRGGRALLEKTLGVDRTAPVPQYHRRTFRKQFAADPAAAAAQATAETRGKVAIFVTCYGNRNDPGLVSDLAAVLKYNGIGVILAADEKCCGMPKLELGDLEGVGRLKATNIPALGAMVDAGYDIVAAIPSCVLMYKQELPLLFPDDPDVRKVQSAIFDPFEYLWLRHKAGLLRTDFKKDLGRISYHVACHLRVQNMGLKTRDVLALIPGTQVEPIERCSGHNGTYAVKKEYRAASMKIGRPVMQKVDSSGADHYSSDCPMAGHQLESGLTQARAPEHPLALLRQAYGI
ncbi:MAG TPA: heterodisulfide reductase-related iron-sulfur binding cluster [Steroidobacteraceae bacterium]|nr:heterodisulfide reductase-related iron-sulfur binding cluster [Steroidobacteraceae bacterium]